MYQTSESVQDVRDVYDDMRAAELALFNASKKLAALIDAKFSNTFAYSRNRDMRQDAHIEVAAAMIMLVRDDMRAAFAEVGDSVVDCSHLLTYLDDES